MDKIILSILLILAFSLTGGGLTPLQNENGISHETTFQSTIDFQNEVSYQITSKIFEINNIRVSYPEIDMTDKEKQTNPIYSLILLTTV